jgi:hypothetical protein
MLLWPHPLIPGDGFIKPEDDAVLLKEASAQLSEYGHVDIIENPDFEGELRRWLGHDLVLMRLNETQAMPDGRSAVLHDEMMTATLDLVEQRSRLDIALWKQVAVAVIAPEAVDALRTRTLLRTAARHAYLLDSSRRFASAAIPAPISSNVFGVPL